MSKQIKAFTLVELIVVITILAILATIGYISLLGYAVTSRDTTRLADLASVTKVLELYQLQTGSYPAVSNPINVTFSGTTIWQQWSFWEDTRRFAQRISQVPIDPLTFSEFAYSKTLSTWEYQVWSVVEKDESISLFQNPLLSTSHAANPLSSFATTVIKWNYNGKLIAHKEWDTVYILGVPSILANEITDVTLQEIYTNGSFVYQWGTAAPATYSWAVVDQWDWNFTPTDVSWDINLIYTGSVSDFNTWSWKLDFIWNLKDYYAGTDIASTDDFQELINIDTTNNPNEAIDLVNTYVLVNEWGLWNLNLLVTDVVVENSPVVTYKWWDYSSAYNDYGGFYNAQVFPNFRAFTALDSDGSMESWWNASTGWSWASLWTGFTNIYGSRFAFAALASDGSIDTWWHASHGWTWGPGGTGYTNVYSTERAFAALASDGSIFAWWNSTHGATWEPTGTGFTKIFSTEKAFVALHEDGSMQGWWDNRNTLLIPTNPPSGTWFTKVFSTASAFAVLDADGGVTAWWNEGSTWEPSGTGYVDIFSTQTTFAALHTDGSIFAWWNASEGWTWEPWGTGYTKIYSTEQAFAALASDGSIDVWWTAGYWWDSEPAWTGYTKIYSTARAFAALASDGSIDAWGNNTYGWDDTEAPAWTWYTKIYSTEQAFAALASDGSIDVWGSNAYGWDATEAPAGTGYTKIYSTQSAFAALASDGSIEVWWDTGDGWAGAPAGTGFVSISGRYEVE